MNILHVLSQTGFTGSEFYSGELARLQVAEGHRVWLVSDRLHVTTPAAFISQPISASRFLTRLKNILWLRRFVKENNIHVVHAHSRAASRVSRWALRGLRRPLISTVHGRQHVHFSSRHFDVYGNRIICVSENLLTHLYEDLGIERSKIQVIPNIFKEETFAQTESWHGLNDTPVISIVGRTTGPKGEMVVQFLKVVAPALLQRFPNLKIQIIGGRYEDLGLGPKPLHPNIVALGFVENLRSLFLRSTLVIASGRTAVESLALGVPTFAVGEGLYEGLVDLSGFGAAVKSNFGDHTIQPQAHIDFNTMLNDILDFLTRRPSAPALQKVVADLFAPQQVYRRIMEVYQSAQRELRWPAWIPVLMYHRVPKEEIQSRHRVFVTQKRFRQHLNYFRRRGFTLITFQDYERFVADPQKKIPKRPLIITFDDGYLDNYENVLPLLKEFNFRIVLFCLADFSIQKNFWDGADGGAPLMSQEQIQAFADLGCEIGSHGLTHQRFDQISVEQALHEMLASKNELQKALGVQITSLAYPFGVSTPAVRELPPLAGYRFAVSTSTGGLHLEHDRFNVFRVNIFPEDGWWQLFKKTSTWYRKRFYHKHKM